jgi:transposase InsO family protein
LAWRSNIPFESEKERNGESGQRSFLPAPAAVWREKDFRRTACRRYGGRAQTGIIANEKAGFNGNPPETICAEDDRFPTPCRVFSESVKDESNKPLGQGEVLVGDITYLPLQNGEFCYLATFQDKYTRRIVGWQVSKNMTVQLVVDAFNRAGGRGLLKRNAIIHTDRGSQYASVEYRRRLYIQGFRQCPYPKTSVSCFYGIV